MPACVRVHTAGGHAAVGHRGPLARGPYHSNSSQIITTFEIQNEGLPYVQKYSNFVGDSLKLREQFSFLAQFQIPSGLPVTNFGTNSNLNLP
jgi:hypothetical protein